MTMVAALAIACGGGDGGNSSLLNPIAGSGGASGGAGGATTDGNGGSGAMNLGTGGAGGGEAGCDKVDFLFIIDNSVSMSDQQAALIASFPDFINTIQTTLTADSDYHIMVVDTDATTRCTPDNCQSGAMSANTLCDEANGYACKQSNFEACDNVMGAGVVNPAGDGASNQKCTIHGGNRYMIEGEPDLTGTFSCVAQVGLAGHPSERPMDALVAAMDDSINAPGGCNEGFLREDAILVITFISDDPNYEDAGVPQDWYDAVVDAKGGNADAVAVLGLTPAFDGCSNASKPDKGKHWSEFIQMWGTHGLEASVCNSSYGSFFDQAVGIIDETCDEFVPPS